MNKWTYFLLSSIAFTPAMLHAEATPKFSIVPTTSTTYQISSTGAITVRYRVTNNTKLIRTLTFKPIPGVSQGTGAVTPCSAPFTLAPKQSCLLTLVIHGNAISPQGIHEGPQVCKTMGPANNNPDPFLCSQPGPGSNLNITLSSALRRRVAVGNATINGQNALIAFTSIDGGASWSSLINLLSTIPSLLYSVTCDDSGLRCVTVGRAGLLLNNSQPLVYTSTNGGNSWSSPLLLTTPTGSAGTRLLDVDCDSTGVNCITVGASRIPARSFPITYTSADGGVTWSLPSILTSLPGNNTLVSIACDGSALRCVVIGTNAGTTPISYSSSNGGQSWTGPLTLSIPPGLVSVALQSVSCDSSGLTCAAVGITSDASFNSFPISYTTVDGGLHWSSPILPVPVSATENALLSITCNSTGLACVAGGYTRVGGILSNVTYQSIDGGNTWGSPILPLIPSGLDNNSINGIFCGGDGIFCTAVSSGDNGVQAFPYSYTSNNGGGTWSAPLLFSTPSSVTQANLGAISGSN